MKNKITLKGSDLFADNQDRAKSLWDRGFRPILAMDLGAGDLILDSGENQRLVTRVRNDSNHGLVKIMVSNGPNSWLNEELDDGQEVWISVK